MSTSLEQALKDLRNRAAEEGVSFVGCLALYNNHPQFVTTVSLVQSLAVAEGAALKVSEDRILLDMLQRMLEMPGQRPAVLIQYLCPPDQEKP